MIQSKPSKALLINHIEADEPGFESGARYKVIAPDKDKTPMYFTTYQMALKWVECLTEREAQLTLF